MRYRQTADRRQQNRRNRRPLTVVWGLCEAICTELWHALSRGIFRHSPRLTLFLQIFWQQSVPVADNRCNWPTGGAVNFRSAVWFSWEASCLLPLSEGGVDHGCIH